MPKFSIILGTLASLLLAWNLLAQAQEPAESNPIPKAIPIAPSEEPAKDEPEEEKEFAPAPETEDEFERDEETATGREFEDNPEPIDLDDIDENDIPKALPVIKDIPKAKPVATEELARLRREREVKRRAEEEEAMRLKRERGEAARKNAGGDAIATSAKFPEDSVIPRALPVGSRPVDPDENKAPPRERLSPMDVASMKLPNAPNREPEKAASKLKTSWNTRTDARSISLIIPAPRGQIVDRWGHPLAQNKVANVLAIKLPHLEGTPDREVLGFARERVSRANRMLGQDWELTDEAILRHFKNRRWLPLTLSTPLTQWQEEAITPKLDKGLILFPTYVRHYPEKKLAAHILGSIRKVRKLSIKPIASGDFLFPQLVGREGLEASFDADLEGTPGVINYLYNSDGTELDREIATKAIPGSTVVTTLDLEMQQLAEQILENSVKRGAFVVMNVHTGEILTMASYPSFDPNEFSPSISTTRFNELLEDPQNPLWARAFRSGYPPASTFKIITALAALESGAITEQTMFPCPTVMMIGDRPFRNWNKKNEDDMNVIVAIARSCNPFFYKAGLRTGGQNLTSMGNRFGFGQKTGIQISGEESGHMPTDASERELFDHGFSGGYLANASIGQGSVAATPLQVCQMMAGVANGRAIPQARIVKQVQNFDNQVTKHFSPQDRNLLNLQQSSLDTVRRGMVKVVNASWGTGKAASNYYVTLAGKTGTGQWNKGRNLAWFAGFVPFENPEYAFAVLYEGDPGEKVGGGRIAAPLAGRFFNAVYRKKKEGGELVGYKRAEGTGSEGRGGGTRSSTKKTENTEPGVPRAEPAAPPEETKEKKSRGFFRGLRRRRQ